jgi:peptidoglycan biosynthesis protein MviN/MurJ (putative lipid II flippase)
MKKIAQHIRSLFLVVGIAAGAWLAVGHHIPGNFTVTQRVEVGALMAVIVLVAGLILAALVGAIGHPVRRSNRSAPQRSAPQRSYGGNR